VDAPRRAIENYIWTSNPFGLAQPPDWFLDQMFAYDPELRIFPSMFEPFYRIMRKVHTAQPWTKFIAHKPDTAIAVAHKLWPVMSIIPQTILGFSWGRVLMEIAERDQQRFANPGAVADHLEGHEQGAIDRIDRDIASETDARSGDFFRAFQNLSGQRISMAYNAPDGVGSVKLINGPSRTKPRRAYRPSGGVSSSRAFFTGRGVVPRSKLYRPGDAEPGLRG
jgi:hypothetical protein